MFTLTDDEKAALDNEIRLRTAVVEARQAITFLLHDYQSSWEDKAVVAPAVRGRADQNGRPLWSLAGVAAASTVRAQDALAAAEKAHAEAQLTETYLIATLKAEANKAIAEKLPGGSYGVLLALAEQTLGLVATEGGLRTVNLVKSAALMLLGAAADPDIHLARARITKTRYDALLTVGLPQDLVHEILVAEASRPWSFPQASANAAKR
jgi:hypothetical protein